MAEVEDADKPRCDMPLRVGCIELAQYAYFDTENDDVLYRCNRHRIKVIPDDPDETLRIMEVKEAVAYEIMKS